MKALLDFSKMEEDYLAGLQEGYMKTQYLHEPDRYFRVEGACYQGVGEVSCLF